MGNLQGPQVIPLPVPDGKIPDIDVFLPEMDPAMNFFRKGGEI
jgi:hypothetical protein